MDPAERRELILSAASRAFASRPYEEVSLAEIAEEAQASEALVHKYFANKAGTYAQVLQRAADELAERTRRAADALPAGSSARDRVRAMRQNFRLQGELLSAVGIVARKPTQ